jgi:hypothetical protein
VEGEDEQHAILEKMEAGIRVSSNNQDGNGTTNSNDNGRKNSLFALGQLILKNNEAIERKNKQQQQQQKASNSHSLTTDSKINQVIVRMKPSEAHKGESSVTPLSGAVTTATVGSGSGAGVPPQSTTSSAAAGIGAGGATSVETTNLVVPLDPNRVIYRQRKGFMRYITPNEIYFLHQAYEGKYWYWDTVETMRRLLLTAVVSVVGTGE